MSTYYWPLPASAPVSQPFGSAPNNGFNPAGGHTGTDFAVPSGTPIIAAADGVIEHAGWVTGAYNQNPWWLTDFGGIVVVLNTGAGNPTFVYAHLNDTALNVGDRVTAGQVIGHTGNTGTATSGPHLHFEALPDGYNLNSSTFGRVNPNRYCNTHYTGTINPAGDITTNLERIMADAKEAAVTLLKMSVQRVDAKGKPDGVTSLETVLANFNQTMERLFDEFKAVRSDIAALKASETAHASTTHLKLNDLAKASTITGNAS